MWPLGLLAVATGRGNRHVSGTPLAVVFLGALWAVGGLPRSVYTPGFSVLGVGALVVCIDTLQYASHRLAHTLWRGSHGVHHQRTDPTSDDAFFTGLADAFLQLLLPLWLTLSLVRPSYETTCIFGAIYGLWLQFIHSRLFPLWRSRLLVTPAFHREHHTHPNANFAHVFSALDTLAGTRVHPTPQKNDESP
jgi:sterol desaturase/sphingolipid hydroxylase (fatty acid hydroxylase superfamily)